MAHMTFNLGSAARIVIDGCHGDLEIRGGDRTTVEVSGDRTLAGRVTDAGGELAIRGYNGDLVVEVGREASIAGRRISGDVEIEDIGAVELESINGDLSLVNVGSCRVDEVGGDLSLELRDGDGQIGRVAGDLRVAHAHSLTVGAVGGDAELSGIGQLAGLGPIGGDLELQWDGLLAGPVTGSVGGDAEIELGAQASFVLRAIVGGDISGTSAGVPAAESSEEAQSQPDAKQDSADHVWDLEAHGGELTATFGSGGEELRLTVGGDLDLDGGRVTSSSFGGASSEDLQMGDFGLGNEMKRLARDLKAMGRDLARDVAREVRHSTRGASGRPPRVHVQWNDKAFHFDADQIDRLTREAREAAADGIARAQEAVERALVNMVSSNRAWSAPAPSGPRPPTPPRAPGAPAREYTGQTVRIEREAQAPDRSPEEVSAEKLAILRMVSEGRLGIDEAEVMLRALEGRG